MNGVAIRRAFAALLLLLPAFAAATPPAPPTRPLTMTQYIGQLDAVASAIDESNGNSVRRASSLVDQLPAIWRVEGPTRTFEIPLASLRLELRAWTTNHDASVRRRLQGHIRMLRSEAAAFDQPTPDRSAQRALMADILSRPDFQDIHGPTWLDRLRQRLLLAVRRWLGEAVPSSIIPTIGSIVVYALIGIAVLVSVRWARRLFTRRVALDDVPSGLTASSQEWTQWLTSAQAAAARGDWRDAVHRTYWCAVSFLEAGGAWRPDPARTPREYLRLLPPSTTHGAMLAALTQRFELVWYGTAHADAQAYAESIENLQNIGCPAA
jgi:hypothetical protein